MSTERFDVAVIGGGISGLSLAHYCQRYGLKVIVIEKRERTGGSLHSHRSSVGGSPFWFELGAHTCYNSYRNLLGLVDDCGLGGSLVPRKRLPFTLLEDDGIRSIASRIDFRELFCSLPRLLTLKKEGLTVREYYSQIAGRKNFRNVLSKAFNAVISQEAADFPADMLFTKRKRRKDVVKSFTFEGGLQRITDALVSRQRFSVRTGSETEKLSLDGKDFLITCSDGRTLISSTVALATPVVAAARLMRELSPEISSLLSGVGAASVESAGVAVRRNSLGLKPVAGMIPKNDSFFSVVSRDVVPDESFRGFTFHFRPGLLDRDGKVARICEVLHLRTTDIEDFAEKENIVPSLTLGHSRLVRQLDRLLGRNRILITGNYFAGLAIEDCVSRSHSEFERLKTLL